MRRLPFEYAVRSLGRRPLRTLLGVASSVLVVFLILGSVAFVRGMRRSLLVTASEGNVILLGSGSEESIERSQIDPRVATIVEASVRGVRSRLGVGHVSPEIHSALSVQVDAESQDTNLTVVRGVNERAFLVHPQVRIAKGRAPEPGRDEIAVGGVVAEQLGAEPLRPGDSVWIGERAWTVSGLLSAPNSVIEGEVWMPLTDLQILNRRDTLSCVVVTMDSEDGQSDLEAFAFQRLDLELTALSEEGYYRDLAAFMAPIRTMVVATTLLVALGGLLGGLNTMYAAFASRAREIGALQVLGFRRWPIAVSLFQESLLLNSIGTIAGSVLGIVLLDDVSIRLSMGSFGLLVDGPVLLLALVAGLSLAVLGAIPPVVRCLRLPISQALRSS
ncbi:MAG: ABC transporter permease [Planctomycetota bacterium]